MNFYNQLDDVRRWQGRWLDLLGSAPIQTPARTVLSAKTFTLKAYGDAGQGGPPLLIIPAPIKRAYIWDFHPQVSAVQQCLRHGISVYLLQWEQPGADEQGLGLDAYADRFISICLDAIEAELGGLRVFLAGHSLGGILAAIFAALHPERVGGLVLLSSPLFFGPEKGALGSLVRKAPRAKVVTALLGNVPGSFLSAVSVLASPVSFQWARWADFFGCMLDVRAMQTHLRVVRWTNDELSLARQLFEDVLELLFRENRFMEGTLMVGGQSAAPVAVDAPLLTVIDAKSQVVPPASILPFLDAVSSTEKRVLWYEGDLGVALQHVGVLVGRRAHRHVWPEIIRWLLAQQRSA